MGVVALDLGVEAELGVVAKGLPIWKLRVFRNEGVERLAIRKAVQLLDGLRTGSALLQKFLKSLEPCCLPHDTLGKPFLRLYATDISCFDTCH